MEGIKITKTNKALKEWNAVIEALGNGKQSIVIRKYGPAHGNLFLYPTSSYARKDKIKGLFREEYSDFVKQNLLPKIKNEKVEIKYLAKIEDVIDISPSNLKKFNKYHIWQESHVRDYMKGKNAKIWVLRVYKMDSSFMASPNRGLLYANLNQKLDTDGLEAVINDEEWSNLLVEIENL